MDGFLIFISELPYSWLVVLLLLLVLFEFLYRLVRRVLYEFKYLRKHYSEEQRKMLSLYIISIGFLVSLPFYGGKYLRILNALNDLIRL
jgi:uncharacterized membrane protein YfcA